MLANGGGTVLATAIGPRLTGVGEYDEIARESHLEVIIEGPEQTLGLRERWGSYGQPWEMGGIGSWRPMGRTVVTLRAFVRACVGGNMTLLSTLFAPDDMVLESSEQGDALRSFFSDWADEEFPRAALFRMKRANRVCFEGVGEGEPHDWGRVVRVLTEAHMAVEFLHERRITLPIDDEARRWMESVSDGSVSVSEVRERLSEMISQIERAPLRIQVPSPALSIQQWLIGQYLKTWSGWRPIALE